MATPKLFTVSLRVAQDEYTATGKTIVHALDKIQPPHIKAKGLFVVSYDGKVSQFLMLPVEIKRMFTNKMAKLIFEKRMRLLLK